MPIAFFSTQPYDRQYFNSVNTTFNYQINYYEATLSQDTVNSLRGEEIVCIFVNDNLCRPVIKELAQKGVKLIALRCAGFNNVDLCAAQEFGIKVVHAPAYSPHAVAEHTIALLLALDRKIYKAYNRVREGNFSLQGLLGFDLYGKTVGVVGTGKIGSIVATIMLAFGCKVLAYDLHRNDELIRVGVQYQDKLEDLLRASDIVTLHTPLTESTRHMINAKTLEIMKTGAYLINTGRGELVNSKAVINALKSEHLGALGIDVYEQEENLFFRDCSTMIIQDDLITRLMTFPNVLITAHQGFFTHEALTAIAQVTLNNCAEFIAGKQLTNEIHSKTNGCPR